MFGQSFRLLTFFYISKMQYFLNRPKHTKIYVHKSDRKMVLKHYVTKAHTFGHSPLGFSAGAGNCKKWGCRGFFCKTMRVKAGNFKN